MKNSVTDYNVSALRKSIAVLEVIKDSKAALGVSEIARKADVSKNMCFRILETLDDLGWVRQGGASPVYELTLLPFQFFASSRKRENLLEHALVPLRQLHDALGESVYLSVLHNHKALNIYGLRGSKAISVSGEIGGEYDLHATAPGKVLLAGQDDVFVKEFLTHGLVRHTNETITDPVALQQEIEEVRSRGFAINKEEFGVGLLGLAAPVKNGSGDVVAAVGVFAPSTNVGAENLAVLFSKAVLLAADTASRNLGFSS